MAKWGICRGEKKGPAMQWTTEFTKQRQSDKLAKRSPSQTYSHQQLEENYLSPWTSWGKDQSHF